MLLVCFGHRTFQAAMNQKVSTLGQASQMIAFGRSYVALSCCTSISGLGVRGLCNLSGSIAWPIASNVAHAMRSAGLVRPLKNALNLGIIHMCLHNKHSGFEQPFTVPCVLREVYL